MNKYLFGIFAIILTFAGKSFAAPLDAYYCFSTQDPQAVVAKFDSYLTSDAAKGLPTVRLWAMLLNGEAHETHCVVFENPNGSSFTNSGAIFNAPEGQAFLQDLSTIIEDGLEGGGTPILNFGEADFNKNPFLVLYNLRVKNASLPILAATLLSNKKIHLSNLPIVKDIETMINLLQSLGSVTKFNKKILTINNSKQNKKFASYNLVKTMRAGILVLGPLLAKFGNGSIK